MNHYTQSLSLLAAGIALFAVTPATNASLIAIDAFNGEFSESWESFAQGTEENNYAYLPEETLIMGGAASITTLKKDIAIFGPESPYGVGALVKPFDGVQGMGLGSQRGDGATVTFLNPVSAFGGYFASYGSLISVGFSDGTQTAFNYGQQNTGTMLWQGWSSDVGITSVSWTGEFVAVDGLQANSMSVPDSGATIALLGLAVGGMAMMRRKFAA